MDNQNNSKKINFTKKLNFLSSDFYCDLAIPDQLALPLTLNTPAINSISNLSNAELLVVASSAVALDAKNYMLDRHVTYQFVVDKARQCKGLITLDELEEWEFVSKVAQGYDRGDLKVTDFMVPMHALKALDYEEVKRANLEDIITSLKEYALNYCLVVDTFASKILGVISARDLARRLHISIHIPDKVGFYKAFASSINH